MLGDPSQIAEDIIGQNMANVIDTLQSFATLKGACDESISVILVKCGGKYLGGVKRFGFVAPWSSRQNFFLDSVLSMSYRS
jgi:hypothetical protein